MTARGSRPPPSTLDMNLRHPRGFLLEVARLSLISSAYEQQARTVSPQCCEGSCSAVQRPRRLRHRVPWPAWIPLGLAAALAGTALVAPVPARAATAATGAVLDAAHSSVNWQSPVYAKGTGGGAESCPDAATDPDDKVCDRFDLT